MGGTNFFKMTVKNKESEFHDKALANIGTEVKLSSLKGTRIGIDASNMIYKAILALASVTSLTDADGETTAHLNTIFNQVLQYKAAGIDQIWLFDNPVAPEIKRLELEKRDKKRKASTSEKAKFKMTSKHVNDIKQLLDFMGIMHIESPEGIEAEQYGAYLTINHPGRGRFCDYIISGDSDVLIFGGNLLRPTSVKSASGKSRHTVYMAYELATVLEETNLTHEQLIKCAITLGTDFSDKVPGIGIKTVANKVRDGKVIFDETQVRAKNYFLSPVPVSKATIVKQDPNIPELIEFLVGKKFSKERLVSRLTKAGFMK